MTERSKNFFSLSKNVFRQIFASDTQFIAASLAYSSILSLIPFLALTLAVFKLIGGLEFLYPKVELLFLQYFSDTTGADTSLIIKKMFDRIQAKALGSSAAFMLVLTSWRLLHDIESGIQRMWSKEITRPLYKRIFLSWLLLLLFPLGLAVYVGFRSLEIMKPFYKFGAPIMDFFIVLLVLYLLYKIIPDSKVKKRAAFIGALVSSIGLTILKLSFTFLAKKAFQFDKIYGSLAAIPLLLFWILLLWYIVLFGVAVGSNIQRKMKEIEDNTPLMVNS